MRRPDGATKTALKTALDRCDLGAFVSGPFSMTSKPIARFSIKPKINAEQKIWPPNTLTKLQSVMAQFTFADNEKRQ